MIVKSNSWHYRFNSWKTDSYKTESKKTLCSYFWFTVKNIVFVMSWPVLIFIVLGLVGITMMHDTTPAWAGWWNANPSGWLQLLSYPLLGLIFIAVIGLGALIIVAVVCVLVDVITYVVLFFRGLSKKKEGSSGLVMSYLKARKEKICPVIKFED
ncbi:hypothetical protein PHYNN_235 [Pantoea phage Phynn]|nr:hypothetical protein PHYNN_235 [Pantoea phage Phynn]